MIELLIIHLMLQFQPSSNAIINGSYENISSMSQLYQLTNSGTGGLEELFLMLLLFFALAGGAMLAGRINPVLSAMAAAIIMTPISLLAQSVFLTSGGALGSITPLIFVGITIMCALVSLLSGFLSPYS